MNGLSRRHLLSLAGAVLAASRTPPGSEAVGQEAESLAEIPPSDEEARQILVDEGMTEPGSYGAPEAVIQPMWFERPEGERPAPHWPQDNVSFDFNHLVQHPNSDDAFDLTAATLKELVALNAFAPGNAEPKRLFGLRGCLIDGPGDYAASASSQRLRPARPDHVHPRCVIGVWDTANDTIAVFKASTVPGVDLMQLYIDGVLKCNCLPTGMHHYKVGAHKQMKQPGAFREQVPLWVVRTQKHLIFDASDPGIKWDDLDGDLPFDNIHAAMTSSRTKPPFFSSAGCQVVAGQYTDRKNSAGAMERVPTGAWAEFRKAAGLAHPPKLTGGEGQSADDGRDFDYILLTGKEAQIIAGGAADKPRALRFGSSGDPVAALQEKLAALPAFAGLPKTGTYDRKTLGAVIAWQVEQKIAPTGIIAKEAAQKLGLNWS